MRALTLAAIVLAGMAARGEQAPPSAVSGGYPPLRGPPPGEPLRAGVEYAAALAAFSAVNAGGVALLSSSPIHVSRTGNVDAPVGSLVAAGTCLAISPFVAALGSYLVGRGSDRWDPSLGWASVGAYGTALVAVGAGLGMAAADVDRTAAGVVDGVLYFAVPLGAVLLQNATRTAKE